MFSVYESGNGHICLSYQASYDAPKELARLVPAYRQDGGYDWVLVNLSGIDKFVATQERLPYRKASEDNFRHGVKVLFKNLIKSYAAAMNLLQPSYGSNIAVLIFGEEDEVRVPAAFKGQYGWPFVKEKDDYIWPVFASPDTGWTGGHDDD